MTHLIKPAPMNGLLPIPHLFQWPDYSKPNTFSAIIPEDMVIENGDLFFRGYGAELKMQILERRPAKGNWSQQKVHKNPHYVRFMAK